MKKYVYHYCCVCENYINGVHSKYTTFGLFHAHTKIDSEKVYECFKNQIWKDNKDKINPSFRITQDDMSIDSLSFLHEVDE